MPIISTIGRRSIKVRLLLASIYLILALGAISMLYPLLLMLSGSAKSETDFIWISPVPQYLWNDNILWMKYIESKYWLLSYAEAAVKHPVTSWRAMKPPVISAEEKDHVALFREFRATYRWPREWYTLGHTDSDKLFAKNARIFRQTAEEVFHGDLEAYCHAAGIRYPTWAQAGPPQVPFAARRFTFPTDASYQIYYDLKARSDPRDWVIVDIDGDFYRNYVSPVWPTIEKYNAAHDTKLKSFQDLTLATTPPNQPQSRKDWETYVRNDLSLPFIRIDSAVTPQFRQFLRSRYTSIAELNSFWTTHFTSFDEIAIPPGLPPTKRGQVDLSQFIKNAACPIAALSIFGPRQAFEQFVAQKRNVDVASISPLPIPTEAVDYTDFQEQKPSLRWEFLTRNYKMVWDFVGQHGNGIRNTAIFCALLVLANLIVNPLAAYALSRYQPPSTYKILLFCMATMAFPAEVTMIPSFLLLKRFPLLPLIVGVLVAILVGWIIHRLRPATSDLLIGLVAGASGILAGWWLVPSQYSSVSLLNSFWALVLPGMGNGFSIFLLKGFFDSLPRELYEAADIDGASEWTKFWLITMNLSKPILAVLALSAFTAAYSEFMMALVIVPDPSMWTLMVWLFQLQSWAHPSVVYASLVIAAIPTMLIFLFCQNLIMRGIVVPVEK